MNLQQEVLDLKRAQLTHMAERVHHTQQTHPMRQLFFELTTRCNLSCIHCGSDCVSQGTDLAYEDVEQVLLEVLDQCRSTGARKPFIVLTGGEPMLHRDFFKITRLLARLGFTWGMTSNATLMTDEAIGQLRDCPPYSASISLDDLPAEHDAFRQTPGCYDRAMAGIRRLTEAQLCQQLMVTTVLTHQSLPRLEAIYEQILPLDIDSWRVIAIEPIGRAAARPDLWFTSEDHIRLFDFIRAQRSRQIPVTTGCSHYLGLDYERDLRDWYFTCNAGITICSVMANGDIGACLDIDRKDGCIQGNIHQDSLPEVWDKRFAVFRRDLSKTTEACRDCEHETFCRGGSHHTYDHTNRVQRVCLKGQVFD